MIAAMVVRAAIAARCAFPAEAQADETPGDRPGHRQPPDETEEAVQRSDPLQAGQDSGQPGDDEPRGEAGATAIQRPGGQAPQLCRPTAIGRPIAAAHPAAIQATPSSATAARTGRTIRHSLPEG